MRIIIGEAIIPPAKSKIQTILNPWDTRWTLDKGFAEYLPSVSRVKQPVACQQVCYFAR